MNLSKQTRSTTNGSPLDPATGSSSRRITRFPSVSFSHIPVMSNSVIELFSTIPSGTVLDATIGGGGHSSKILKSRSDLNLIGLDQDPEAIEAAEIRLKEFGDRVILINERFDNLHTIVNQTANQGLSGVLFDLGVSSYQLDNPARGFSYRESGPLDMRMNTNSKVTAHTLVNEIPKEELAKVLRDYGDERFSRRIADAIFAARPIKTTKELSGVISDAMPARSRRSPGHPARRSFQALRIAVNSELEILETSIKQAIDNLKLGGRGAILSYHSGEDKIVKRTLREFAGLNTTNSKYRPEIQKTPVIKLLATKAEKPSESETLANPRSSSALLRVFEKVGE